MTLIEMYVVYEKPKDYPDKFVARKFLITEDGPQATDEVIVEGSLWEIKKRKPYNYIPICRATGDDPCIVEVWM